MRLWWQQTKRVNFEWDKQPWISDGLKLQFSCFLHRSLTLIEHYECDLKLGVNQATAGARSYDPLWHPLRMYWQHSSRISRRPGKIKCYVDGHSFSVVHNEQKHLSIWPLLMTLPWRDIWMLLTVTVGQ